MLPGVIIRRGWVNGRRQQSLRIDMFGDFSERQRLLRFVRHWIESWKIWRKTEIRVFLFKTRGLVKKIFFLAENHFSNKNVVNFFTSFWKFKFSSKLIKSFWKSFFLKQTFTRIPLASQKLTRFNSTNPSHLSDVIETKRFDKVFLSSSITMSSGNKGWLLFALGPTVYSNCCWLFSNWKLIDD